MPDRRENRRPTPVRFVTGIRGLDEITRGGLLGGGIYLVMGPPGSGKTILANQICFHHIAGGGRALFLTLLAESHDRMFAHLGGLSFFERKRIGQDIIYVSAYRELEKAGVAGLIAFMRREILKSRPSVLVVDGLAVASELAGSAVAFKKFVHELNIFTASSGCTALLLTSADDGFNRPEHTMVDGIIGMSLVDRGMRVHRDFEVRKLRGTFHLQGRHYFRIGSHGISIFPRLEARLSATSDHYPGEPLSTGIAGLDQMMRGGLPAGSVTALLGTAGSGKTTLGINFLAAGLAKREQCLHFGFYETPASLLAKAERLGFDFAAAHQQGRLTIAWQPPTELYPDELVLTLLDLVRKHKIKRLFLDGAIGLFDGMKPADRPHPFMSALTNELRALRVTTVMTEEIGLLDPASATPPGELSTVAENIVLLRNLEIDMRYERTISVVKMRDADCDRALRRFSITVAGVHIHASGAEAAAGKSRGDAARTRTSAKRRRG